MLGKECFFLHLLRTLEINGMLRYGVVRMQCTKPPTIHQHSKRGHVPSAVSSGVWTTAGEGA